VDIRPSVFVAVSSERVRIAGDLQELLQKRNIEVTVWDQDAIRPSMSVLGGLIEGLNRYDFGVFIFARDDNTLVRGEARGTVRDNVLFEMGLFIGRLGRERTLMLVPRDADGLRVASDLLGIVPIVYDLDRDDGHVIAALAPAANGIARRIEELGPREDRIRHARAAAEKMASGAPGFVELTPQERIVAEKYVGRASFVVIHDDICHAATDIIVSSDDNHFTARGGVSKAILHKLGPDVRRQLDYFGTKQFRQGQLAITTGGTWQRRAVFHAAVIDLDESRYPNVDCIRMLTRRVLECAVAVGARSLALPVLGGGHATRHLSPKQTVNLIASEVLSFLSAQDSQADGLTRVALYLFKRDDIDGLPEGLARWDGGAQHSATA
jgi:O-acetyl-ADP-ribose deacetylase (regulator of RNase III)